MTGWGNAILDKFPWDSTSLARVKDLYREGVSTRQIAITISAEFQSVGRNAVIGIIHRNKFESPMSKTHKLVGARSNLAPVPRKRTREDAAKDNGPPKSKPIALPAVEGDALLAFGTPCRLVELRAQSCRWPLGVKDFMFCNAEQIEGFPYCERHRATSSRPYTAPLRVPGSAA
jgi:hypothetical protein